MEPTHSSPPPPTSVSSPNSLHQQHDERVRMSSPSSSNNVEQGQDLTSRNEVCNYSFSLINTMKHQSQLSVWSFFNLNEASELTQYIQFLYKQHVVHEMPILKARKLSSDIHVEDTKNQSQLSIQSFFNVNEALESTQCMEFL